MKKKNNNQTKIKNNEMFGQIYKYLPAERKGLRL